MLSYSCTKLKIQPRSQIPDPRVGSHRTQIQEPDFKTQNLEPKSNSWMISKLRIPDPVVGSQNQESIIQIQELDFRTQNSNPKVGS